MKTSIVCSSTLQDSNFWVQTCEDWDWKSCEYGLQSN